jgi:hypothetical protein
LVIAPFAEKREFFLNQFFADGFRFAFVAREKGELMLKRGQAGVDGAARRGQARVDRVARLLERAAKKHNESADATCSVAVCFERPDRDLSDEMFDSVFEMVAELARVSLEEKKPDYLRAARKLLAKAHRRGKNA